MKPNWLLCGLAAAGLGFALVANSQESKSTPETKTSNSRDPFDPNYQEEQAPEPIPMQVQVQVEFVEMSHEALTKMLFLAKPTSADATKLREQVQDMVFKNEAKVLETQIVVARHGQKATSESNHEFIYPTEYEQLELSGSFAGKSKSTSSVNWPLGPVPTAFETRNLGSNLEIEPAISDENRLVDLRFVPELVWHTGNITWHEGKDQIGSPFRVQMPDIYSMRLSTSLQCISGQYTLAGVVSPKDDKGDTDLSRKVMVFVKCDVLEVK